MFRTKFSICACAYGAGDGAEAEADEVIILPVVAVVHRVWTSRCAAVSKGGEGHRRTRGRRRRRVSVSWCTSVPRRPLSHLPT